MKKIDVNQLTIQAKYLDDLRLGVFEASEPLFPFNVGIELKRNTADHQIFPGSLFTIEGVEEISARATTLKLRLRPGSNFKEIAPLVGKHLRSFLGEHVLPWSVEPPAKTSTGEIHEARVKDQDERALLNRVEELLENVVAPSLSSHGGSVKALGFEHGALLLQFSGGCQGCSQISSTVKFGIEKIIAENFPEIKGVIDVTEHADGDNPYFT